MGIDPSGSDLHLGHAVPLRKLREFQELGHRVILLIGDYTARIGDPTGKSHTRVMLTEEQIQQNMKHYARQAGKILDMDKVEVRYNSEWYEQLSFVEVLQLASSKTVAQFLHREDFKLRYEAGKDISLVEFLYPLMQGYDSVKLQADVELGGTDQTFNMLVSRDIQEFYQQAPEDVITVPILEGLDGKEKMSKSLNNYIALEDTPEEMFGKIMSIPDVLIVRYFALLSDFDSKSIDAMNKALEQGENPRDYKMMLAKALVSTYHSPSLASRAEESFIKQFSKKEIPENIPDVLIDANSVEGISLLVQTGLVPTRSEARRMIDQGAVKIDQKKITDPSNSITIESGMVLQVGKRKFVRIITK